jgi:hypothetical protein
MTPAHHTGEMTMDDRKYIKSFGAVWDESRRTWFVRGLAKPDPYGNHNTWRWSVSGNAWFSSAKEAALAIHEAERSAALVG